jgi:hypothetical protein
MGMMTGPAIIARATVQLTCFTKGNTPLHLAMESAHAEAAVLLIEAGADRSRVCTQLIYPALPITHPKLV